MGSSDTKLTKKLYNIIKQQRKKLNESLYNWESITLNIDFEKWNLMMREELSALLFKNFDR